MAFVGKGPHLWDSEVITFMLCFKIRQPDQSSVNQKNSSLFTISISTDVTLFIKGFPLPTSM